MRVEGTREEATANPVLRRVYGFVTAVSAVGPRRVVCAIADRGGRDGSGGFVVAVACCDCDLELRAVAAGIGRGRGGEGASLYCAFVGGHGGGVWAVIAPNGGGGGVVVDRVL